MRWRTIVLGVRGRTLPAGAYPEPDFTMPPFRASILQAHLTDNLLLKSHHRKQTQILLRYTKQLETCRR